MAPAAIPCGVEESTGEPKARPLPRWTSRPPSLKGGSIVSMPASSQVQRHQRLAPDRSNSCEISMVSLQFPYNSQFTHPQDLLFFRSR
jgi:hypothetical protein